MLRAVPLWTRFVLIMLAFTLPIVLLMFLLVQEQGIAINFAEAELRGVEYHRPARQLFADLMRHRTNSTGVLAGDASFKSKESETASAVETSLQAVKAVDAKLGAEMHTSTLLSGVEGDWVRLKGEWASLTPEQNIERHDQLIYKVLRTIIKMGNHSNLILDPDIDTYYLMDATQFKLPALVDQIGHLQARGLLVLTNPAPEFTLDEGSRARFRMGGDRVRTLANEGSENLVYTFDANPTFKAALSASADVNREQSLAVADLTEQKLALVTPAVTRDEWMAATNKAFEQNLKLFDASLDNLEVGINTRVGGFQQRRLITFGLVGVSLLLSAGLSVAILFGITSSLRRLATAAEQVSLGQLDIKMPVEGNDEITDLARKFGRMQESIRLAMQASVGGSGADQL